MGATAAANETFADVEKLVHRLAWNWSARTGIDVEDCLGAAHEGYVHASETYKHGRGAYTTWVWHNVALRLRRLGPGRGLCPVQEVTGLLEDHQGDRCSGTVCAPERKPRLIERMLREVGEDARTVIRLVVECSGRDVRQMVAGSSGELSELIAETPADLARLAGANNPAQAKNMLWNHLKNAGWTVARVIDCFSEIREAIAE